MKMKPIEFRGSKGITGLETAIVLIAFVVVSTTFAFAALSVGLENAERAQSTIGSGVDRARATLELKGSVLAIDTGDTGDVDEISFFLSLASETDFVDLTQGNTLIQFKDQTQFALFDNPAKFSVEGVGNADEDLLLEPREIYRITLLNLTSNLIRPLATGDAFTLEITPQAGAVLRFNRTIPIFMDRVNDLGNL